MCHSNTNRTARIRILIIEGIQVDSSPNFGMLDQAMLTPFKFQKPTSPRKETMIKAILGATLLTLLIGCATATPRHQAQWLSPDYDKYFADRKGCFLLYNMKTQVFDDVIGEDNCRERLPACSTFKIALSVMAFDSGVLKDENEILKWDGKKGFLPQHDRDHNAKTWLRDSVVWF
jgi:beta-lactamase class D